MAPDKSLAAEIEAVLAGRDDERVARILCGVWGYRWDGNPDIDENVIPERDGGDYDRPDKDTFIAGAVAIRSQIIAPLIAALQSRAFEDGARWMREVSPQSRRLVLPILKRGSPPCVRGDAAVFPIPVP